MSLSPITTWNPNDDLLATDLTGEFANIYNNPLSLISPLPGDLDVASHVLIDAIFKNAPVVFADGDTTPAVTSGTVFKTANTGATVISFFDGGYAGQRIYVVINDAHTTVDFSGTNLSGNAGADWTPSVGDLLQAVFISPKWYCTLSTSAVTSGLWTPNVGGTATYTAQFGKWVQQGKQMHITMALIINVLGTGSTNTIHGLPKAGGTSPTLDQALAAGVSLNLAISVVSLNPCVSQNTTDIVMYGRTAAANGVTAVDIFGDGAHVEMSGTYITD